MRGNHTLMFLSLSPFLPLSLKINKIFLKTKNKNKESLGGGISFCILYLKSSIWVFHLSNGHKS